MNSSDIQIWNNATFENTIKMSSWSSSKQQSDSLDADSTKENWNLSPIPPVLQPTGNSVLIPNQRILNKEESAKKVTHEEIRDENKIDSEIEEIQKEISRLTSRLDTLRLEKSERKIKALDKLGRMVPAKFMEQKKIETKVNRTRGLTMGPSEIASGFRRGVSMGPAEIFGSRQLRKQEVVAAITPIQNRRKSCFWKLEDVDEKRAVTKERGSSFTVSPKWRKEMTKITPSLRRQAATTVGSKKPVQKFGGIVSSAIQPKILFRDGDNNKSLPTRKPQGKVVASRYNPPSEEKQQLGYGMRKKKWDIPSPISPVTLPMIRTVRLNAIETPRDSGPAKRVVDMVGKKSYFCNDDDEDLSVSKALNFE